jgi:Meiotically up-regulated gene 113
MIYFIRSVTTRHIKIGYSKKPVKRQAGLQSSNADRLEMIGQMHGDPPDEADLHERFRDHRLHGEWFGGDIQPQVAAILSADVLDPRLMRLNVIVSGDRDFRDDALVRRSLDELHAKDPRRPISFVPMGDLDREVHGGPGIGRGSEECGGTSTRTTGGGSSAARGRRSTSNW